MQLSLPKQIKTIAQAKRFLTMLYKSGYSFHPEDDAKDIVWSSEVKTPTMEQCEQLNKLMDDIYNLPGNDGKHIDLAFDPCQWLLDIDLNHFPDLDDITKEEAKTLLKIYSREKIINWILWNDRNASVSDEAQTFDYGRPATKPELKKVFWSLYEEANS